MNEIKTVMDTFSSDIFIYISLFMGFSVSLVIMLAEVSPSKSGLSMSSATRLIDGMVLSTVLQVMILFGWKDYCEKNNIPLKPLQQTLQDQSIPLVVAAVLSLFAYSYYAYSVRHMSKGRSVAMGFIFTFVNVMSWISSIQIAFTYF